MGKIALFGALGTAVLVLLFSDRAKGLRTNVANTAKDKAGELKTKLGALRLKTSKTVGDLRTIMTKEIKGLNDDARKRISNILDEAAAASGKIAKDAKGQLA